MTEATVSSVVTMLKRKMVTDRGMRIKYALLALLSAVILPTSHNPRILHAAAEKIKDVEVPVLSLGFRYADEQYQREE